MAKLKDRVKLGVSPSTDVEDMDCRYMKGLDTKNTRTVVVPEQYLRSIEKDSHILEILQSSTDEVVWDMLARATAEYCIEIGEIDGHE